MPTLNKKSYALPTTAITTPADAIPKASLVEISNAFIHVLGAQCPLNSLDADGKLRLTEKLKYHAKKIPDVLGALHGVTHLLHSADLTPDEKYSIAIKATDSLDACTEGFQNRLFDILTSRALPQSFDDLLSRIRKEIVHQTAMSNIKGESRGYEVHAYNYFFTLAESEGYGVPSISKGDRYTSRTLTATGIRKLLKTAFQRKYEFFAILNAMENEMRSALAGSGFTGRKDAGKECCVFTITEPPSMDVSSIPLSPYTSGYIRVKSEALALDTLFYVNQQTNTRVEIKPSNELTFKKFDAIFKPTPLSENPRTLSSSQLTDISIFTKHNREDTYDIGQLNRFANFFTKIFPPEITVDQISTFNDDYQIIDINWPFIRQKIYEQLKYEHYVEFSVAEESLFNCLFNDTWSDHQFNLSLELQPQNCQEFFKSPNAIVQLLTFFQLEPYEKKVKVIHTYLSPFKTDEEKINACFNLLSNIPSGITLPIMDAMKQFDDPRLSSRLLTMANDKKETPLILAAKAGDTSAVQALLTLSVNPSLGDSNGSTALHWAAYNGRHEVVRLLISSTTINQKNTAWGLTALQFAIQMNKVQVVRILLDADANTLIRNKKGKNALDIALGNKHMEIVEHVLLKALTYKSTEQKELLKNVPKGPYDNVLLYARDKHPSLYWKILRKMQEMNPNHVFTDAQLNAKNSAGNTPLIEAAKMGDIDAVRGLLALSVNPALIDENKANALHWAASLGHHLIIRELSNPTCIDIKGKGDNTPLLYAVTNKQQMAIETLLEKGANLTIRNQKNNNALDIAIRENQIDSIESILAHAMALSPEDQQALLLNTDGPYDSVLSYAQEKYPLIYTKLMTKINPDSSIAEPTTIEEVINSPEINDNTPINEINPDGNTALMRAIFEKETQTAMNLLEQGADIRIRNNAGQNALEIAIEKKHNELVEPLLLKAWALEPFEQKEWLQEIPGGPYHSLLQYAFQQHPNLYSTLLTDIHRIEPTYQFTDEDLSPIDQKGYSPLMNAANKGNIGAVHALLALDINKNLSEHKDGHTALIIAAGRGCHEIIRSLLDKGTDIEQKNHRGNTALHIAIYHKKTPAVKVLLQHNADMLSRDIKQRNALDMAIQSKSMELIEHLLLQARNVLTSEQQKEWLSGISNGIYDNILIYAAMEQPQLFETLLVQSLPVGDRTEDIKALNELHFDQHLAVFRDILHILKQKKPLDSNAINKAETFVRELTQAKISFLESSIPLNEKIAALKASAQLASTKTIDNVLIHVAIQKPQFFEEFLTHSLSGQDQQEEKRILSALKFDTHLATFQEQLDILKQKKPPSTQDIHDAETLVKHLTQAKITFLIEPGDVETKIIALRDRVKEASTAAQPLLDEHPSWASWIESILTHINKTLGSWFKEKYHAKKTTFERTMFALDEDIHAPISGKSLNQ